MKTALLFPGQGAQYVGMGKALAAASAPAPGTVVPANLNSPSQIVISGEVAAVEQAMAGCRERGAKRAVRLEVSGAFHSPLMASAAEGLKDHLESLDIRPARIPVIANV